LRKKKGKKEPRHRTEKKGTVNNGVKKKSRMFVPVNQIRGEK